MNIHDYSGLKLTNFAKYRKTLYIFRKFCTKYFINTREDDLSSFSSYGKCNDMNYVRVIK